MAFGNHEYQHRYFKNEPHKKYIQQPNQSYAFNNSQLPPAQQYYSPQLKHQPLTNQLNIRVRAAQNSRYELGAQGSRIKQYIIDKYSQNYIYNRQMLDKFKRESQEYRKRKRFGSKYQKDSLFQLPSVNKAYYQSQQKHINDHINRRMYTEPQLRYQPQQYQKTYYNHTMNDVQEQEVRKYNVGVMARIQNSMNYPNQYQIIKRKEKQTQKENIRLKQYKKKYKKLKNKLQEQILSKKLTQYELKRKQQEAKIAQRQKLQNIQHIIHDISDKLHKNSLILNQSIKVQDYHSKLKEPNKINTQTMKQSIVFQYEDNHNNNQQSPYKHSKVLYIGQQKLPDQWQQNISKRSPKVVYEQKSLRNKYKESQELEKEIQKYNNLHRHKPI